MQEAADFSFGIKLGAAGGRLLAPRQTANLSLSLADFARGQHLCAFGLSEPTETLDLTQLSSHSQQTEIGIFAAEMQSIRDHQKAGFLGIHLEGSPVDFEDVADSVANDARLLIGASVVYAPDADTLSATRLAALNSGLETLRNQHWQDLLLPANAQDRARLANRVRALAGHLERIQTRMDTISEEIDALLVKSFGLTEAEPNVIVERCRESPLSHTVGRPRYLWSPERKVQERRIYEDGARYRSG